MQQVRAGSRMHVATEPKKQAGQYVVRKNGMEMGWLRCLTHVILPVDDGVVVCRAAGVSLHGFNVISAVGCVDGSLELTLQHSAVAGRGVFTCRGGGRMAGRMSHDVKPRSSAARQTSVRKGNTEQATDFNVSAKNKAIQRGGAMRRQETEFD